VIKFQSGEKKILDGVRELAERCISNLQLPADIETRELNYLNFSSPLYDAVDEYVRERTSSKVDYRKVLAKAHRLALDLLDERLFGLGR